MFTKGLRIPLTLKQEKNQCVYMDFDKVDKWLVMLDIIIISN